MDVKFWSFILKNKWGLSGLTKSLSRVDHMIFLNWMFDKKYTHIFWNQPLSTVTFENDPWQISQIIPNYIVVLVSKHLLSYIFDQNLKAYQTFETFNSKTFMKIPQTTLSFAYFEKLLLHINISDAARMPGITIFLPE